MSEGRVIVQFDSGFRVGLEGKTEGCGMCCYCNIVPLAIIMKMMLAV